MAEIKDLNITDASNTGSAANAGFPENMNYSDVNNAARALEGLIARWYADGNSTLDTTGATNTYALAPNRTISAYARGDFFVVEANHTNTGAATLNVSSLGATAIVTTNGNALVGNEIVSGGVYAFAYDGTSFQLLNPAGIDLNQLATSTTNGDGDYFAVVDTSGVSRKLTKANVALSGFNNDSGWTSNTGDITGVTAGTAMDGGGTSGAVTLNLDLSELSTSTTNGDGDYFVVVDTSNAQRKLTKANVALSGFNNDSGWTTNTGDITGVTAGVGLSGGGSSGSVTLTLDLSELTSMTSAFVGTDEFVMMDNGAERKVSINELRVPVAEDTGVHTFADTDMNEARHYTGGTSTHAWTMNTGVGDPGKAILIVNDGSTDGPTITAGTATVDSSSGNYVVKQEGIAVLYCTTANNWKLSGDLTA
jgi:hypothetical protein